MLQSDLAAMVAAAGQGLERFEQLDVGIANVGAEILGAARVGSRRLAARRAHPAWIVGGRRPNADKESAGVVEERGSFTLYERCGQLLSTRTCRPTILGLA